jgi:hypothetical protein
MSGQWWLALVAVSVAACGERSKDESPPAPQAEPSATQSTELRDAVQEPLERAEGVQETLDERADQMRATMEAEMEGADDPTRKDDDDAEDGEE